MADQQITILQGQIVNLANHMDKGFNELKQILNGVEQRLRSVEITESGSHPVINDRIDNAWKQIEIHDKKLECLEGMVEKLINTNNILKWILGIITTIGVGTFIKLITSGF